MLKVPLTHTGHQQLVDELKQLKSKDRPDVISAIKEAREHGDLKENAEYAAAKERQSLIESRILHLESLLAQAQVIDVSKLPCTGKVVFGVSVTLYNLETEEEADYKIVGEYEADIKQSKVSVTSPLARALIGREEGDVVSVKTPTGVTEYEILKVAHSV